MNTRSNLMSIGVIVIVIVLAVELMVVAVLVGAR